MEKVSINQNAPLWEVSDEEFSKVLDTNVDGTAMLQSCWGESAAASPSPETWAIGATDFMLSLNTGHNGKSLSV